MQSKRSLAFLLCFIVVFTLLPPLLSRSTAGASTSEIPYRLLATEAFSDSLLLIDPNTGAVEAKIGPLGIDIGANGLTFAPDGTLWSAFLTATGDYLVTIDTSTGEATIVTPITPMHRGRGVEFGPDGKALKWEIPDIKKERLSIIERR